MDGLKQQKAIAKKQIEKIKANISGLDRTISNIQAKKGITPKTTKHIEDHLKIISAKKRKIKDLITKIGDIKVGMKMQYTMNREQRERNREQREIEREQRERNREQRKTSKPVLAKSSKKLTPNEKTKQLSKALDDLGSNKVAPPLLVTDLLGNTTKQKPNFKKALLSPSQQQRRPQQSALTERDEFHFRMFKKIDEKEKEIIDNGGKNHSDVVKEAVELINKIQKSVDQEMKQSIDRLYKTAIFRIVDDTNYALLKNKKKSIQIKGTKQLILDAINKKYNTAFKSFNEFIEYCAGLPETDELKKINLYNKAKYNLLDYLIESCVDLLIDEIKKSTEDEIAYREFRHIYLHNINEYPSKYVSLYNKYIRENKVPPFTDEEKYRDFIRKVFIEKGKYVGSYAYQQYLLNKPNSKYETRHGYGQDNLHLYLKSENNKSKNHNVRLDENMVGIQLSNSDLKKRLLRLASSLNIDIFISTIKKIKEDIEGKNNESSNTKEK